MDTEICEWGLLMGKFRLTKEEYAEIIKKESQLRDGSVKRRLRVLSMRFEGYSAEETARTLGMNKSSIYAIFHRYETQGLEEFIRNKYAKTRRVLTEAQEKALIAVLEQRENEGQIITTQDIVEAVQAETGEEVARSYVYAFLKRNGWRKLLKPCKAENGESTNKLCWMPVKKQRPVE